MIKALRKKLGEALTSVFPVTAIVFILNLTPLVEFSKKELNNEEEIDRKIYELYGLTDEEIQFLEKM